MAVPKYEEPPPEHSIFIGDFWGAEWEILYKHHSMETKFLLDIIQELLKRLQ